LVWLRKHGRLEWNKSNPMKGKKTPQQEIKELKKKLKRAEQTNQVLNRAVDIADATLGTSIRKKYLELLSEASEQPAPQEPTSE
jgi:transposase